MRRLLYILVLILTTSSCLHHNSSPADTEDREQQAVSPIGEVVPQEQPRDMLRDGNELEHHPAAAVLSDAQDIYRICNSRPQRLQPTFPPKPDRINGGRATVIQQIRKTFNPHNYGGKRYQMNALFLPQASCDYYVIALRHIIR